ncbi:Retrovirus-related Pol polyprotein LINE-1, partial [Heterocephalus glaber]
HCWWENRMVQPLWKTVWQLLTKLNTLHDPAITLLGLFLYQMNFSFVFSRSMKCTAGISIGIALNL